MERPAFFLSSTIYDFKDLRSSIKFYLEELGHIVLASEFNDFPKPLETHSYNACTEAIKKADYFILLVGSRVGGWYDPSNKISITQHEYREAYKLHKQNKIKIITFVRRDVWQFREQRKELTKYLEKSNADAEFTEIAANAPSKFASNAKFISDFIEEISRNSETKAALADGTDLPTGNWLHVFDTFRDVVDAINTQTFSGSTTERLVLKRLLSRELTTILKACLLKIDSNTILSPLAIVCKFHEIHSFEMVNREFTVSDVDAKLWERIRSYSIHLISLHIHTHVLDKALESPAFLRFEARTNAFIEEPIYEALSLLQSEIRSFQKLKISEILTVVLENTSKTSRTESQSIKIDTLKLMQLLHALDRWVNITQLSTAILRHFSGHEYLSPYLRKGSPIKGMDAELDKERMSDEDVENFIIKSNIKRS